MDFTQSDEHLMLREAVSSIASKFGHEYYVAKARADGRTTELWDAVGEAGFLGVSVPEEYGGGGGGITELALVTEELAAAGCPLLIMVVSPAICATIIAKFGTEAQKQRWLPQFATGELKMAFAITEPDAGSNSHNLSLTATKDGDIYRLNGSKYYISGVDEAQAMLVVTRSGIDPDTGRGKLSLFVVDTDTPGLDKQVLPVEITAPEKQYTLFFDNVQVEADRLIGAEGEGLRQVFFGLNPERILSASIANGISRYVLDKAAAYARERQVWGTPIGRHQGISHPLGQGQDRGGTGPVDDRQGGLAVRLRRGHPRSRRGGQHGQVRGGGGHPGRPRPGHPDPRGKRHVIGVRDRRPLGHGPAPPHRPGQPGDDPQLRGPALPGVAQVVLSRPAAGRVAGGPV